MTTNQQKNNDIYYLEYDNTRLTKAEEQELLKKERSIINNFFTLSVADLLAISGDDKRFQKIVMVLFSVLGVIAAFIINEMPFVFFSPEFHCYDENRALRVCKQAEACSNQFGYEVINTKNSLTSEFGLFCEKRTLEINAKSFVFFFAGTLVMFWSVLSDKIGRLSVFYGSWIWTIKGTIISYFTTNYYFSILGLGLAFGGVDLFYSTLFIYTNEVIGSKMRSLSNGLIFSFYGMGGMFFYIYNIWVGDYRTLFLIQFICIVILGCGFFYICETPFYLYKTRRLKQLYVALKYINEQNNRKDIDKKYEIQKQLKESLFLTSEGPNFIENMDYLRIAKKKQQPGEKKFKKSPITFKLAMRLFLLTVVMGNLYITYGLTLLIPQKLGIDNIYINGVLLGASEMAGYLIITFIAHKTRRKLLNLATVIATIAICTMLMVIKGMGYQDNNVGKIFESGLSIILKLFISMNYSLVFTYGSELFPTKLRGLALGISVFVGRFLISFCSYLELFAEYENIHPMVTSGFGAILALPCILILPETLNKKMSN